MKIYLLVIFSLVSLFLNAQINKGAVFIGGDLSLNASTTKNADASHSSYKNDSYYFSPSLGWAVKDNVIFGARLTGSFFKGENQPSANESKGNNIGAGIWMRRYLGLGKSFYLFADAGIIGQSVYRKQTNTQQPVYYYKEKGYSVNAAIYPGISYQVKKSLFLEAALNNLISLGYGRMNTEQKSQDGSSYKGSGNSFNASANLTNGVPLQIGIRWIVAKN